MFSIRPCEDRDYDAVARIHNAIMPEPTTGAEMLRSDRSFRGQEGVTLVRVVAEGEAGEILAYGFAETTPWSPTGQWQVEVMVSPARRGLGIGQALYQHLRRIPVEAGAVGLEAWVRGEDDASLAWAERRGFRLERQRTESVLDLTGFDPGRFPGAMERVEESGLQLVTATEVDEELLRQLWVLDTAVTPDIPCFQPDEQMPTFEQYRKMWRDETTERVVAGCFDAGRLVGVSILYMPLAPGGGAYTGFTGTDRDYRGRGIALALKLLTIREAIARQIPHMRTNNDPDNPSMLAVNQRLGYQLVPGPRRLKLEL